MVDKTVLATKVASVRDAIDRIRSTLPGDRDTFLADRSVREIVILNLFVALQDCVALAAHWLADAGLDVHNGYREMFTALAERGFLERELADRLATATGCRQELGSQVCWDSRADRTRVGISEGKLGLFIVLSIFGTIGIVALVVLLVNQ